MLWKAQKRSFKQFGGGRFLGPELKELPPSFVPIWNKGGNFFNFEKIKKSSLRMFWKAQKRSFKQFGGGRFLANLEPRIKEIPPYCVPICNRGGFLKEFSWSLVLQQTSLTEWWFENIFTFYKIIWSDVLILFSTIDELRLHYLRTWKQKNRSNRHVWRISF